jgi:hypothetical protein
MYEIGEASLCRGVTRPDWTVSAAGSPRPVTGESNGPSPSVTGSRLLSVAAARYRVGTFFSTPGPGRSQEVGIAVTSNRHRARFRRVPLDSARWHPECTVEPDDLAVEHAVVDDVGNQ